MMPHELQTQIQDIVYILVKFYLLKQVEDYRKMSKSFNWVLKIKLPNPQLGTYVEVT